MLQLHETHPTADEYMQQGEFSVQRCEGHAFSQIPVDQTIEQTVNLDSNTAGGIIGFSLNKSALQRRILTTHDRAAITQSCRSMAGLETDETGWHKEASKPRIKQDEESVALIVTYLMDQGNPFQQSTDLVSLTSGVVAPGDITDDLLQTKTKGDWALNDFVNSRLHSTDIDFFHPLKKLNLESFGQATRPLATKAKETTKVDLDFFARSLVIAQNRQFDLREVFKYDLGRLPLSLGLPDGRTTKSKLSHVNSVDHGWDGIPPHSETNA